MLLGGTQLRVHGKKAAREGYIHRYIKTQAKELEMRGGGREGGGREKSFKKRKTEKKKTWAATK